MGSTFTWDDAFAYAEANIARICTEQGITVRINDPSILAESARLLRIGKVHADAARVECPGAGYRWENDDRADVRA